MPTAYMLGVFRALLDISTRGVGKLSIPDKVLCTMQSAPIPVSPHDGADEVRIVLVRSVISDEITALNLVGASGDSCGRSKSKKASEGSHD